MPNRDANEIYFDSNGVLTERKRVGQTEVVVHYDNIPDKDITTVHGIPCTTALRTVIDMAKDLDSAQLDRVLQDCFSRRLFTIEDASARLAEPDMLHHPGGGVLRRRLFG
jgi:hypothetical protein